MARRGRSSFVRGAAILAVAGFVNRALGAVARIVLPGMIGDEGVGLFQMAFPIYNMFLVVSTAGVPVAVSKLVAEEVARGSRKGAKRVLRVASFILLATGTVFTLSLMASSEYLSIRVLKDPRAFYSLIATAPAVLILSVMAGLRGYFQGLQDMVPSGMSQITEQLVRIGVMLGIAYLLLPKGIEYAAAGASFGAVAGGIAGFANLLASYYRRAYRDEYEEPPAKGFSEKRERIVSARELAFRIFSLSLPIVLGASIMPLMQMVDAALVPLRLNAAGYSGSYVTRLYGQLTGMALPLVYFPTIVTMALAASTVPAVSEALAYGDTRLIAGRADEAIRLTFIIGLPASLGLYLLADEICGLLFRLPAAGIPLRAVAFGTIFLCLQQTTSGILQGLGRVMVPVRNLLIGAVVKAVVNYTLTGMPAFGIKGAALGTVAGFGVASLLNLAFVLRGLDFGFNLGDYLIRPGIATVAMGLVARGVYDFVAPVLGGNPATLAAIGGGAGAYAIVLLFIGGIKRRDIELLPRSEGLVRFLERLKLVRN